MYFVYALTSLTQNRIYVGLTDNIPRRLKEHNNGFAFSTKGYRPWKLFYKENFKTRAEARIRENN